MSQKKPLDISTIDFIEIKGLNGNSFKLSPTQSIDFVNNWNNAKAVGPSKYIVNQFINVNLKSGETRSFRINKKHIKESNDYSFEMPDNGKLLEALWSVSQQHMQSISSIFESYVEHQESTDSDSNKELMKASLNSISRISMAKDLETLINVWMYYDPTDFSVRSEVVEILINSRPLSIVAVKSRQENKKEWEREGSAPYAELEELKSLLLTHKN